MASLRERFKVAWDNGDEIEITTTVKDLITAVDLIPEQSKRNHVAVSTRLIHCALLREGFAIPEYDEWILVLDMYDKLPLTVEVEGPTQAVLSPTAQSSSLPSREPIGVHGLKTTTAH